MAGNALKYDLRIPAASLLEMGFPLALNRATARFTGGEKTAQEISADAAAWHF